MAKQKRSTHVVKLWCALSIRMPNYTGGPNGGAPRAPAKGSPSIYEAYVRFGWSSAGISPCGRHPAKLITSLVKLTTILAGAGLGVYLRVQGGIINHKSRLLLWWSAASPEGH